MNKRTIPMMVLTMLLLFAGCTLFGVGDSESSPEEANQSLLTQETVTVEEGERAALPSLGASLLFVEKMADSRCPMNVTCVWEGQVKLALEFTVTGQAPVTFEMIGYIGPNGYEDEGSPRVTHDALGHRFTLQRVDPFPVDGVQQTDPVTAVVQVIRL